jgi:hypothetical protein
LGYNNKVLTSSVVGLIIFALLGVILYLGIITFVPLVVPYDVNDPVISHGAQSITAALWLAIGLPFSVFLSSFIGGWWGTNADERSEHGTVSGFIVGGLGIFIIGVIAFIGVTATEVEHPPLLSALLACLVSVPFFGGIGSVSGLLGSGCGYVYKKFRKKVKQN